MNCESYLFFFSFCFTLTAAQLGHLVTCKQFEWGGIKPSI